ncbi:MAG: hypothetical protein WCD70_13440 [Alphaproteobacteria bacterium]
MMNSDDLTGYKIHEGELKAHEIIDFQAMLNEGIEDDTDSLLPLSLRQSVSNFVPCQGTDMVKLF